MNHLTKTLVDAHIDDLRRAAQNSRNVAAARHGARHRESAAAGAVTIRIAGPDDAAALTRLAALDSSEVPAGPALLAEVGGELRVAVSLSDRAIIADPFEPTAAHVQLLQKRAEQLVGARSPRLRRLREAFTGRARRTAHRGAHIQPRDDLRPAAPRL